MWFKTSTFISKSLSPALLNPSTSKQFVRWTSFENPNLFELADGFEPLHTLTVNFDNFFDAFELGDKYIKRS